MEWPSFIIIPGYFSGKMSSDKTIIANNDYKGIKCSLILAGGGARLSYQAGVLIALEEEGLSFSHFDGTSGGIFTTAMICSNIEPKEMARRWRTVKVKDFSSLLPFTNYFSKKTFSAIGDADGIINKIFPALGIDVEEMNSNSSIDATFNICNFSKKRVEVFSNRNVTLPHLIAGMSLPMFMPAIKISGDWYTDSVWIKDANITEALNRKADEIWLVWAIGNTHEYLNGIFNQYVHMIEMSAGGGLLAELEQIEKLNRESGVQKIVLHVIKPEFPLPLDPDLMLNKITIDELINRGYADAKRYLQSKPDQGVLADYKASMMSEPGISFNFRAHFEGIVEWNLIPCYLSLKVSFNFRLINDELVLRAYSSLSFNRDQYRISTYNNKVTVKKGERLLIYESDFIFKEEIFHLQCDLELISQYDLLMGLEFKKAICTITGGKIIKPGKFILKQKALNRIKNIPFIHISGNNSWSGKLKKKFKILGMVYK